MLVYVYIILAPFLTLSLVQSTNVWHMAFGVKDASLLTKIAPNAHVVRHATRMESRIVYPTFVPYAKKAANKIVIKCW